MENPLAAHGHTQPPADEKLNLGSTANTFVVGGAVVGVIGIVAAYFLGASSPEGSRRFLFAYLTAFGSVVAVAVGATFFMLMQHLVRAGWSVNIRRVIESIAATMPVLAVLSIPLIISVARQDGALYRWAQAVPADLAHYGKGHGEDHGASDASKSAVDPARADHSDHSDHAHPVKAESHAGGHDAHDAHAVPGGKTPEELVVGGLSETSDQETYKNLHPSAHGIAPIDALTASKSDWLNTGFWTARLLFYFAVLSIITQWYWRQSAAQDTDGDTARTNRMSKFAPVSMICFGLSTTFMAFDIYMSLDPHWFSTMFGIYFFAGGMQSFFATLVLLVLLLQNLGFLKVVTKEHFHDMGKFMFAWTFFWGYVAFSQFMLIWYASIPEETGWFARRGASTAFQDWTPWSYVAIALLVGHLLMPFPGLISRHVKRNRLGIAIWAMWILAFHYLDHFWLVMPELDGGVYFGVTEVAAIVGVVGIFVAAIFWNLGRNAVRPVRDPRVNESLAFTNV